MKIPATVITGFLGAGKTTLIRHLLENAGGRRIALVINEFGDLGIDKGMVDGCGIEGCEEDDVLELANGCICCTVADDFLPAMEKLLAREVPPDHIVIETSGLALPKPLIKAFAWPEVRSRVTVDGVITVVDAPAVVAGRFADDPSKVQAASEADDALDHESPLEEVFEDQLLSADIVLLNKADLLANGDGEAVRTVIAESLRPGAKVIETVRGATDPLVLLGVTAAAEDDIETRRSHHDDEGEHDHDDFESFVIEGPAVADPATLAARVEALARSHDVLRVKGFAEVTGKPMRLVLQAVGPRVETYFDRPWESNEPRGCRLVVIGETGLDRVAIEGALRGQH